jgi:hypothetical protein
METVTATAKVSDDGTLTLSVPPTFNGATVEVQIKKKDPITEPLDEKGWPVGFFEKYVGCIKDPKFKRQPQPEADPPPSFE